MSGWLNGASRLVICGNVRSFMLENPKTTGAQSGVTSLETITS